MESAGCGDASFSERKDYHNIFLCHKDNIGLHERGGRGSRHGLKKMDQCVLGMGVGVGWGGIWVVSLGAMLIAFSSDSF